MNEKPVDASERELVARAMGMRFAARPSCASCYYWTGPGREDGSRKCRQGHTSPMLRDAAQGYTLGGDTCPSYAADDNVMTWDGALWCDGNPVAGAPATVAELVHHRVEDQARARHEDHQRQAEVDRFLAAMWRCDHGREPQFNGNTRWNRKGEKCVECGRLGVPERLPLPSGFKSLEECSRLVDEGERALVRGERQRELDRLIDARITARKDELRGAPGDKGERGEPLYFCELPPWFRFFVVAFVVFVVAPAIGALLFYLAATMRG